MVKAISVDSKLLNCAGVCKLDIDDTILASTYIDINLLKHAIIDLEKRDKNTGVIKVSIISGEHPEGLLLVGIESVNIQGDTIYCICPVDADKPCGKLKKFSRVTKKQLQVQNRLLVFEPQKPKVQTGDHEWVQNIETED